MNSNQETFGDLFVDRLEQNALAHGINFANFGTGTVFNTTGNILKSVGYGTLGTVTRSLYGTTASIIIGDGTSGTVVGSLAGLGAGLLATTAATAILGTSLGGLIGAGVAAGLTAAAAGVLFQSLYEAYDIYHASNVGTPTSSDVFPNGIDNFDPNVTVLDPIIVTADYNPLQDYYDAMGSLIDFINQHNSIYETSITIDWFLNMDIVDWSYWFQYFADDEDAAWSLMDNVVAMVLDIKAAYEANKAEIDAADPTVAQKVVKMMESAGAMYDAAHELYSPLVVDLNGNGIETISLFDSHAQFDFDDGFEGPHGWIGPSDGFLALDANGNGIIDNASELFGGNNRDGFSILSDFDENGDGFIDASDNVFSSLLVWRDLNGDGISTTDEVQSLGDFQINRIGVTPSTQNVDSNGNWIPLTSSVYLNDGAMLEISDVYFSRFMMNSAKSALETEIDSYVISGTRNDDIIISGQKSQFLTGNMGNDTFIFTGEFGHDIITDFSTVIGNTDTIRISSDIIADFDELSAIWEEVDEGVLIEINNNNSITIYDKSIADLASNNFEFC